MQLVFLIMIVVLGLLALAGWYQAWRSGGQMARPVAGDKPAETDLTSVQSQAAGAITNSIQQASELFQKNLTVQALKVNDELEGLAGQRLRKQVDDFTAVLDGLTATATASVGQLEALVDQRRQALEAGMKTEVLDEKSRTLERFYGRLNDIVASYIIQSLGNDIDLSGQLPFVINVLNQNKESIKKDLIGDY
jgi:hypothetical protein